ncbi:MAG: rhomboid family intramembrane serine protease [Bacteroidales bacterium]|nr:rhomboid family intramembrane serine protease [Bacteroidales bacterium]
MTTNPNIRETLRNQIRQQLSASKLFKLIVTNVAIFLIVKIVASFAVLFNISPTEVTSWLAVPASLTTLLHRPWTTLTYMFMHEGLMHLFMNMLCLYWFGQILLQLYPFRRLLALYILGGLVGAAFYIGAYNIFPYFENQLPLSMMLGASGAIMAIMTAVIVEMPHYRVRLLFLGDVPLIYLVVGMILISMLSISGSNAGGEFCHIGGACVGLLYALCRKHGFDFLKPFDTTHTKRQRHKKHEDTNTTQTHYHYAKSDIGEAEIEDDEEENIEEILTKLRRSGPSSLTDREREIIYSPKKPK